MTSAYVSVSCASRLQTVWISIVYVYKGILLAVGLYFTWNTRQVSQLVIGLNLILLLYRHSDLYSLLLAYIVLRGITGKPRVETQNLDGWAIILP